MDSGLPSPKLPPSPSSSSTKSPAKRQCRATGVRAHEGEHSPGRQSFPKWVDPKWVDLNDPEFWNQLEMDTASLKLPPLEAGDFSDFSTNDIRVSDYDVCSVSLHNGHIVIEPADSVMHDTPPPTEVLSTQARELASLIFSGEEPALPLVDGGGHPVQLQGYPSSAYESTVLQDAPAALMSPSRFWASSSEQQNQALYRRRLLIEKELTESDVGGGGNGMHLPKDRAEKYFAGIPEGPQGSAVIIHDGVTPGKEWIMRMVACAKVTATSRSVAYTLKDTHQYLSYYVLNEGDWIQLFRDEPSDRYVLKFERCSAEHQPPAHQAHLVGKTWKVIVRKMLSKKDCKSGRRAVGTISLEKKKAEQYFPQMRFHASVPIELYDWTEQQTWHMALRSTHWPKGPTYVLDKTAKFCSLHSLRQYDFVDILKSDDLNASYAIRAWKSDDRI